MQSDDLLRVRVRHAEKAECKNDDHGSKQDGHLVSLRNFDAKHIAISFTSL
jgi:hypothetical protein